jgi:hypothetical protein
VANVRFNLLTDPDCLAERFAVRIFQIVKPAILLPSLVLRHLLDMSIPNAIDSRIADVADVTLICLEDRKRQGRSDDLIPFGNFADRKVSGSSKIAAERLKVAIAGVGFTDPRLNRGNRGLAGQPALLMATHAIRYRNKKNSVPLLYQEGVLILLTLKTNMRLTSEVDYHVVRPIGDI